jgi:hypothetical protein
VRLLGVGLYHVTDKNLPVQQQLFEDSYKRKRDLEEAVLALRNKGRRVQKASLMRPKED